MPMNGEVLCLPEFHFLKRKENGEFKIYTTHDNQPSGREKWELSLGRMNAIEIMNFLAAKLCVISPEKYIEPLVEVTDNAAVKGVTEVESAILRKALLDSVVICDRGQMLQDAPAPIAKWLADNEGKPFDPDKVEIIAYDIGEGDYHVEQHIKKTDEGYVVLSVSGGTFEFTEPQDPTDWTPKPAYEMREVSPGWYNIFDGDKPLHEKNMRKKEAIAELERILKDGK